MAILGPSALLGTLAGWIARPARRARLAIVASACVLAFAPLANHPHARGFDDQRDDQRVGAIGVSQLPREGREVLALIHAGGPFASPRDGIVFGNRERILPRRPRAYYAEFTVPTPGAQTRGARRIIAGRGNTGDIRNSGEYYYTDDHYQSFRRIVQ